VAMSLWNGFLRRRIAEQTAELERRASHDALTGLPNRALLQDRLEQALAHSERAQSRVAVLFLDLDGFKPVNDNLGHAAGDELLKGVAVRLQECVRKGDTVARLGGDEFVLVLQGTSEAEAQVIADRVLQALRQPVQLSGQEVRLAGSLGVSLTSDQALDADTLLQHADMAMYRAKQSGRNNCQFYNEAMAQTRQDPRTAPPL
jgi:diguanylate cyclase (GGDEF)-like protein